jgi:hypothetical protein
MKMVKNHRKKIFQAAFTSTIGLWARCTVVDCVVVHGEGFPGIWTLDLDGSVIVPPFQLFL